MALAVLFSVINVIMAIGDKKSLDAHFTVLVIASLMVTLLFAYFSPKVRKTLNALTFAFFVGFLVIVVLRARDVLVGS